MVSCIPMTVMGYPERWAPSRHHPPSQLPLEVNIIIPTSQTAAEFSGADLPAPTTPGHISKNWARQGLNLHSAEAKKCISPGYRAVFDSSCVVTILWQKIQNNDVYVIHHDTATDSENVTYGKNRLESLRIRFQQRLLHEVQLGKAFPFAFPYFSLWPSVVRDLGCFFAFLQTEIHTYSLGWTRAYCVVQGFGRAAILPQLPEPPCLASSSFMTNTCKPTKCNVHTDKNTNYHLMPGEFSPPPKKMYWWMQHPIKNLNMNFQTSFVTNLLTKLSPNSGI